MSRDRYRDSGETRCAIYTRKSTEEGLDQDFNTLDAQRDSGEAYVASMKHEGWTCVPDRYDDGGYTGGNMDRPALTRLLADIESGKVNCVVVYKVDRLSRSLLDFAKIMQVFDDRGVSFVSVTQRFDTSSSMGRLMLNVLLSFAQFEREIISERTRDKMAAARRKGKYVGGRPILGYDVCACRLVVNEVEAERVRRIFGLYAEHGALLATVRELDRLGWRTKGLDHQTRQTSRWQRARKDQPPCAFDQRRLCWQNPAQGCTSTKGNTTGSSTRHCSRKSKNCYAATYGPVARRRAISSGHY